MRGLVCRRPLIAIIFLVSWCIAADGQTIEYLLAGDFPGNNPILAAAGVDLGTFTATFDLDLSGDSSSQTTLILISEAMTGDTGLPDTVFEATGANSLTFSSFVAAEDSVLGLDTHVNGELMFAGSSALNQPLDSFVSGTVSLGVQHPAAGLLVEEGVISSLTIVPEPSSAVLLGIVAVCLFAGRRARDQRR